MLTKTAHTGGKSAKASQKRSGRTWCSRGSRASAALSLESRARCAALPSGAVARCWPLAARLQLRLQREVQTLSARGTGSGFRKNNSAGGEQRFILPQRRPVRQSARADLRLLPRPVPAPRSTSGLPWPAPPPASWRSPRAARLSGRSSRACCPQPNAPHPRLGPSSERCAGPSEDGGAGCRRALLPRRRPARTPVARTPRPRPRGPVGATDAAAAAPAASLPAAAASCRKSSRRRRRRHHLRPPPPPAVTDRRAPAPPLSPPQRARAARARHRRLRATRTGSAPPHLGARVRLGLQRGGAGRGGRALGSALRPEPLGA